MIRIIVESHIPYIKGLLEPMARVEYLDTCDITAAAVRDADALLVRTRTRCDASLLEGSRVRFIGTATIGTDHIDLDYCRERGIEVVNAPGCNAPAVAQWVHAALGCWLAHRAGSGVEVPVRQPGGTITVRVEVSDDRLTGVTITGRVTLLEEGTAEIEL